LIITKADETILSTMIVRKIFKLTGLDCAACSIMIDSNLEDTTGIVSAKTNYAKAQTEVSFDDKKISGKEILAIIKRTGYSAAIT